MSALPDHGVLAVRRLAPATGHRDTVVLLHGWGMHSGVWEPLLARLGERFAVVLVDLPGFGAAAGVDFNYAPAALLDALALVVDEPAHYLGWSLGGNVAAAFAARCPGRVLSLATIASTPRFVAAADWPCGMPAATFDAFAELTRRAPARGLARFIGLMARGDAGERALARRLHDLVDDAPTPHPRSAAAALDWLGALDQRADWTRPGVARRHYFAAGDALVDVATAAACPDSVVLDDCGHVPLSHPAALLDDYLDFAATATAPAPDKRRVAASFGRAASGYDAVAHLQRDTGMTLTEYLPDAAPPGPVVDLGCGTGYFLPRLQWRYPEVDQVAVDLAHGMVAHARRHRRLAGVVWAVADAEALPFADASVGLLFSNLTLQWCSDPAAVFREARRVLAPGGVLALSTLTDGSLAELRRAWRAVDGRVHVNRFYPADAWLAAATGLRCEQWRCEARVLRYRALRELLAELRALGAHNVNAGRTTGLTGRGALRALEAAYESGRGNDGRLPATYQLAWGVFRR